MNEIESAMLRDHRVILIGLALSLLGAWLMISMLCKDVARLEIALAAVHARARRAEKRANRVDAVGTKETPPE